VTENRIRDAKKRRNHNYGERNMSELRYKQRRMKIFTEIHSMLVEKARLLISVIDIVIFRHEISGLNMFM